MKLPKSVKSKVVYKKLTTKVLTTTSIYTTTTLANTAVTTTVKKKPKFTTKASLKYNGKTNTNCQTLSLPKPGSDYRGTVSVTVSGRTCQSGSSFR